MKILKVFGVVAGIHLFALLLIFANPGCSSTTKRAPVAADTAPKPGPAPVITVPITPSSVYTSPIEPAPASSPAPVIAFNPDTPAAPASASTGQRIVPTRPDTPVAAVLTSEGEKGFTPATTYAVKSGDNFSTIAKKNGITVAQLTAANSLTVNSILRPGQKLIIPSKALPAMSATDPVTKSATPTGSVARTGGETVKHTVKSGDTLGAIARSYGVTSGDIAVANNISDPTKIRPGMELTIPHAKSGAKSAKATTTTKTDAGTGAKSPAPFIIQPLGAPDSAPATAPASTPAVPVIPIDERPTTPAPTPKS